MPIFEYKGLDQKGKAVRGRIDGDNARIARAKLRKQGLFPTEITEKKSAEKAAAGLGIKRFFKRVKLSDLAVMTRQLATLFKANVPMVDALAAISDQIENERLKIILIDVKERVNEGSSLAAAMAQHSHVFTNLYTNMVKAGETAGTLDTVLSRLADYTESSVKLKNKVIGSMTYPVVMMVVGILIVSGLLAFVIPQITTIFEDMEQSLPLVTQIVIGLSDLIKKEWYLIIAAAGGGIWLFKKIISTEKGKYRFDKLVLKMPLFGRLARMVAIARFASTLSTLLKGGVPLLSAMDIVKNVVDNRVIRSILTLARENISEGQPLAAPLKESGEFPAMVTHMIAIGEKTGELEAMLNTVAEAYDNEVNTTVGALTQVLEPLMIVIMGISVGFIVMAIILPILDLNKIAG